MKRRRAIEEIDTALAAVPALRSSTVDSPEHVAWVQSTGLELARIFGTDSIVTLNFTRITYAVRGAFISGMFEPDAEQARQRHHAYLRGLDLAAGVLHSARVQLEHHGVDRLLKRGRVRSEGARVFVSHGLETQALVKLERFLRALGTHPIVMARGVGEHEVHADLVRSHIYEADAAVILATADQDVGGHLGPRPNVLDELWLAQEHNPGRIIYLQEEDCVLPSDLLPGVWTAFTQVNMERAFEAVARDLHAMELV